MPLPSIVLAGTYLGDIDLKIDETEGVASGRVNLHSTEIAREELDPPPSERMSAENAFWRCDDDGKQDGPVYSDCHGVAVLEASWRGPFRDLALILIGALVSLVMEFLAATVRGRGN